MRYIATYLIYAALLVRVATGFSDQPIGPLAMGLLAAYGIVLVTETFHNRRIKIFPWLYLPLQACLVVGLLLAEPELDYLPILFAPLSFQAVEHFHYRTGKVWIVLFSLAMAVPLMVGWEWRLQGVVAVLLYTGVDFMMGNYSYMTLGAIGARQGNQRLLAELQEAHRRLQDYAAQVEEYAVAQERTRMAQELHDSVTQTIFSMNLSVQSASMLLAEHPKQAAEQLERLQGLARSAVGEIQVLVSQLQPVVAEDESLAASLRRLVRERQEREGLVIDLEVRGERYLPPLVKSGLLRIAQEALNNVVKHAGTKTAVLRLNLESRPVYLEVIDDGAGFDAGAVSNKSGHLGLSGMQARAQEIGWSMQVTSKLGSGTRVCVQEAG